MELEQAKAKATAWLAWVASNPSYENEEDRVVKVLLAEVERLTTARDALVEARDRNAGHWAETDRMLKAKMAEVKRLTAEKTVLRDDIIDQARCLAAMIDPVMGDMYCRGWRRALETLEKSIAHGAVAKEARP